jgi:hypothetical protein
MPTIPTVAMHLNKENNSNQILGMMQDKENVNKEALIENDGFLSKDRILALDDRNIETGGTCKLLSSQDLNEDKQSTMGNVQLISLQCTNANTIRFRLPIFISDVDLQQTVYTLYDCGPSGYFVSKRFLDIYR